MVSRCFIFLNFMKKYILTLIVASTSLASGQVLPMTQTQQDVANIAQAANGTTYYGQQLVASLNRAHAAVWSLPDDRLEAALNAIGAEAVAQLVMLHSATALALNQSLDAVNDPGPRAIILPSREYTVDGEGHITVTPLEEPEPQE